MAIAVADNFSYQGQKPLDARTKFGSVIDMAAYDEASLYDGCIAYVANEKKYYTFDSNNAEDVTTGKWREFSGGGGSGEGIVFSCSTSFHTTTYCTPTVFSGFDDISFSTSATHHSWQGVVSETNVPDGITFATSTAHHSWQSIVSETDVPDGIAFDTSADIVTGG